MIGSQSGRDFLTRAPLVVLPALLLAGCGGPKQVEVDHAWVRLPPVAGHPAAAYFDVEGGPSTATLVAISTPQAAKAQMHESRTVNGMATMVPLARVDVPAGHTIKFEPGGKHVMLFDLAPSVKPGGTITLHVRFADGHALDVPAQALAASAPAPVT
jgi:copper(I)-binding protein